MAIVTNQSSIGYYSSQLHRKILELEESLGVDDTPGKRESLLNEIKMLETHISSLKNTAGTKNFTGEQMPHYSDYR